MEQDELAASAGIARATVIDFERGHRAPRTSTVAGLRAALERAGIQFIDPNGGGPGVRLRRAENELPE
jgi:transcriptional regulator with XRE-family HTH domain